LLCKHLVYKGSIPWASTSFRIVTANFNELDF
jgi:hypothetical protein